MKSKTRRPRILSLRTPTVLKYVTECHVNGDGLRVIADNVGKKFGIKVSHMGIKGLIQKESHKNTTMIATNDELALETEKRLKKSLDRIDQCSDIIWDAIQRFKDPMETKEVLALSTLIRTMKETIEVNLKYVGGVYSPNQTVNIENQQNNIYHNDIDFAAKVARQIDSICSDCKYKQKYVKSKVIDI